MQQLSRLDNNYQADRDLFPVVKAGRCKASASASNVDRFRERSHGESSGTHFFYYELILVWLP